MSNAIKNEIKKNRVLQLYFRLLNGEELSIKSIAQDYEISEKSVYRDIKDLKDFLESFRYKVGKADIIYSEQTHTYKLDQGYFLSTAELYTILKVLIGSRALTKEELLQIIEKLNHFTSQNEKVKFNTLFYNEVKHYKEVNTDNGNVINNVWQLAKMIEIKNEITVTYKKMSRNEIIRRIRPVAIIFSEYYFYLIAYEGECEVYQAKFYRIDRITKIVQHRNAKFEIPAEYNFDEGELRQKIQFMWPGKVQKILFEFTGPSVQAILDRIPTANIIKKERNKYTIEAEVLGSGIKMYLLSQGSWVKVLGPTSLVEEMRGEIDKMRKGYGD